MNIVELILNYILHKMSEPDKSLDLSGVIPIAMRKESNYCFDKLDFKN